MKQRRLEPSLGTLELYCKACDALEERPNSSVHAIADYLGRSPSVISECISHLEKWYGSTLIARMPRSNKNRVTAVGRNLRDRAAKLLREHANLAAREPLAEVCVGTTNTILVHVIPEAVTDFMQEWRGRVHLSFREYDYPKILEELRLGRVDFGIGPAVAPSRYPDVRIDRLERKVDVLLVTHPKHPFATTLGFSKNPHFDLEALASELVFVLSPGLQPAVFEHLPPPDRASGGERVEVDTYSAILAFVRMGIGVGLVPGWYAILDELRRQGLIFYHPIPELSPITIAAYRRKGQDAKLSAAAAALLETVKKHFDVMDLKPGWRGASSHIPFPTSIERFRYAYHVSCSSEGWPEWRRSKIIWQRPKAGKIVGVYRDLDGAHAPADYRLSGQLEGDLLHWTARLIKSKRHSVGDGIDRFVAVFNTYTKIPNAGGESTPSTDARDTEPSAIIGAWVGFDDNGSPVSGSNILATRTLTVQQANRLLVISRSRVFLNAQLGQSWPPHALFSNGT